MPFYTWAMHGHEFMIHSGIEQQKSLTSDEIHNQDFYWTKPSKLSQSGTSLENTNLLRRLQIDQTIAPQTDHQTPTCFLVQLPWTNCRKFILLSQGNVVLNPSQIKQEYQTAETFLQKKKRCSTYSTASSQKGKFKSRVLIWIPLLTRFWLVWTRPQWSLQMKAFTFEATKATHTCANPGMRGQLEIPLIRE